MSRTRRNSTRNSPALFDRRIQLSARSGSPRATGSPTRAMRQSLARWQQLRGDSCRHCRRCRECQRCRGALHPIAPAGLVVRSRPLLRPAQGADDADRIPAHRVDHYRCFSARTERRAFFGLPQPGLWRLMPGRLFATSSTATTSRLPITANADVSWSRSIARLSLRRLMSCAYRMDHRSLGRGKSSVLDATDRRLNAPSVGRDRAVEARAEVAARPVGSQESR